MTEALRGAEIEAGGGRIPRARRSASEATSLAVIVAAGLWAAWLTHRGWFYYDDFANLTIARDMGLGWDYLSRDVFGHFSPGLLLPVWMVATPGRGVYFWAALTTVVWFVVMLVLVERVARALGAQGWAVTAAVALTAVNVAWDPSLLWWAAQLNTLPVAVGALVLLLGHLRHLEGRRWGLPAAVAGLAWALACSEGAILFIVPVVLVTGAWVATGDGSQRVRFLLGMWRTWLAYLAPLAVLLALRSLNPYSDQSPTPAFGDLVTFPWHFVAKAFAPAQFGWTIGRFEVAGHGTATAAVATLLGLALAVWFIRRVGAPALVVFASVGAVLVLRGWLIGYARLGILGQRAAAEPRYVADLLWLLPVLAAGAWARRNPKRSPGRPVLVVDVWFPQAAVPVVALIVLGMAGQWAALHNGQSLGSRQYYERFRETLADAEGANAGTGISVLDTAVPASVIGPQFGPFVFVSRTVDFGVAGVRYNDPERALHAADESGAVRPIQLDRYAELRLDAAFTAAGEPALASRSAGCWSPIDEAAVLWLPLSTPVLDAAWVLDLAVTSSTGIDELSLLSAGSAPLARITTSPHGYGASRWLISAHPFSAAQIGIELALGQELCLASGALAAPAWTQR